MYSGAITDVPGIEVGHATHAGARTGVTAVIARGGAIGGVDVRGGAPGTRETDALRPGHLVERANGILLCGGSAYGLDAAAGAMRYFERRGEGFPTSDGVVPIVGAAVIYDLGVGDGRVRPDGDMGALACIAARKTCEQGRVGAGAGATVGKLLPGAQWADGGVGTASITLPGGCVIGAVVVVNAAGDVRDPHSGEWLACGRMPGTGEDIDGARAAMDVLFPRGDMAGAAESEEASHAPAVTGVSDGESAFQASSVTGVSDGEPAIYASSGAEVSDLASASHASTVTRVSDGEPAILASSGAEVSDLASASHASIVTRVSDGESAIHASSGAWVPDVEPASQASSETGVRRTTGANTGTPHITPTPSNTTIGVVATDARLTVAQANHLATMAQDGFARAIVPVHLPVDGDTVFALSTGEAECEFNLLCAAAAEVMARAVANAALCRGGEA